MKPVDSESIIPAGPFTLHFNSIIHNKSCCTDNLSKLFKLNGYSEPPNLHFNHHTNYGLSEHKMYFAGTFCERVCTKIQFYAPISSANKDCECTVQCALILTRPTLTPLRTHSSRSLL